MLSKISPQQVKNEAEDYMVRVVDRRRVAYEGADLKTEVEVDFGMCVGVYGDSPAGWFTEKGTETMTPAERELVLGRVDEALQFMGSKTSRC